MDQQVHAEMKAILENLKGLIPNLDTMTYEELMVTGIAMRNLGQHLYQSAMMAANLEG